MTLFDWDSVSLDDLEFCFVPVRSGEGAKTLKIQVTHDAIKIRDTGFRQPATAAQMQRLADRLDCMLLTPLVVDLVWRQAKVRFDAVVNVDGKIVAGLSVEDYNDAVDECVSDSGGPVLELTACVGKYWVVCNALARDPKALRYGKRTAANYGWFSSRAPRSRRGVTGGDIHPWQTIGTAHNDEHVDPSQVVRLMHRKAELFEDGAVREVDLRDIAVDPVLVPLLNHDGILRVLRQPSVPEPTGVIVMPEETIRAKP